MAGTLARSELENPTREMAAPRPRTAYAVASADDEADLRELLREAPMAGAVRVCFTREPAYFAHEGLLGAEDLTIIARRAGRLLCMGHCSTRDLYVDGTVKRVGYLGELRMRAGEKGGMAHLRGGYRFFREQVQVHPADLYFTSIASDNTRAQRVLENGGRMGLPAYRLLANLVTFVAPVSMRGHSTHSIKSEAASREELTAFLETQASSRNLALPWNAGTWAELDRCGVSWRDFTVVRRGGRIVAAAALWDQCSFRQTVIAGYSASLALIRPIANAWNACWGRPGLPAPSQVLEQASLIGLSVEESAAWSELWFKLATQAAKRSVRWIVWSTDENETRRERQLKISGVRVYRSRLYSVHWDDLPKNAETFGGRPFRPEVALL